MTGVEALIIGSRRDALVLASGSATRALLLRRAGVSFQQDASGIDEAEARAKLRPMGVDALAAARELARLKAAAVAPRHPGAFILGADQLLDCEGVWLDKPASRAAARDQLLYLSGRRHRLATAAVLIRDGEPVWSHVEAPELTMRRLSGILVEAYLDLVGEAAFSSVGAYQLEGPGAQLIEHLSGDVFAVLGLPLLPLLSALRRQGVLP
ncbi:MAG: Maf family protein [Rhodospirillales bacterium]|nr:Maf family protein [Rhodospirillales bacterium]